METNTRTLQNNLILFWIRLHVYFTRNCHGKRIFPISCIPTSDILSPISSIPVLIIKIKIKLILDMGIGYGKYRR